MGQRHGRRGGSAPGRPTSGSRNGRFRCTGPRPAARARRRRATATSPVAVAGTPGSWNHRTRAPNSAVWSMVWAAPTSRELGGRSAVTTSIGTVREPASTTAGRKLAAAALARAQQHGRRPANPAPSATNPASPLVVDDVHATVRSRRQRQGHRGAARAGRDDGVADAAADELVDERGAARRLGVAAGLSAVTIRGQRRRVAPVVVEVWSDVVCPWCYIGNRRFAAGGPSSPSTPTSPSPSRSSTGRSSSIRKRHRGRRCPSPRPTRWKFGGPEQAAAIIEHITATAAAEGLEFHLDRAQRANTRDAHRLLWYAATVSRPPGAQAELKERLLVAYFVAGRNVADPDVLVEEAAAAGLDADEVRSFLDSDAGHAEVDAALAYAAWKPGSPPSRRTSSTGAGRSPGPRTPQCSCRCSGGSPPPNVPADALAVVRRGAGRALVLVHGFTQTGRSWDSIADELAARHTVLTPDAPGHGDSSAVRADLPAGAELLGRAGGRATYIGYSMGGRLCLHLAIARPALVERLVLISATAGIDDSDERAARRSSDDALAATIERDGVDAFLRRWVAQPMFATLDEPGWTIAAATRWRDWRRASGSPARARRRRCGTCSRRWRCPCSSSPAPSMPSSSRLPSGWRDCSRGPPWRSSTAPVTPRISNSPSLSSNVVEPWLGAT